jgi:hypothetical protein
LTQIRRGAEQNPIGAIRADSERGLGSRGKSGRACANGAAIRTIAIPLRETAAGARSEDFYQHSHRIRVLDYRSSVANLPLAE